MKNRNRRQLDLQGPPNCCLAGPHGEILSKPPAINQGTAKGMHISILEEPEQEHRRNDQMVFNTPEIP